MTETQDETTPATAFAGILEKVAATRRGYTLNGQGTEAAIADLTRCHKMMQQAATLIRILSTPNLFWPEHDSEFAVEPAEWHEEQYQNDPDDLDLSDVMSFDTARNGLPMVHTAVRVTQVDRDGNPDGRSLEFIQFSDHADAARCYPESLAAARAAASHAGEAQG